MRTTVLTLLAVVGLPLSAAAALDPNDPADAIAIDRKIQCSTKDGEATTYHWEGYLYSRRQGEKDRRLFAVEGMNVRACTTISDPDRGEGYKLVSREILLYKNPETGEVLSQWDNPWTGETVDVLHVANDPVNFSSFERRRDGSPHRFAGTIMGEVWHSSFQVPLFYPNPLASDYQQEIGGIYHATEMFNFFGTTKDLLNERRDNATVQVGWARMSDWLPWMKMAGREGLIYVHSAGRKLESWDDLSETMKAEIAEHYPDYTAPPPLDDDRRNETSWMYYKRVTEGERTAPQRN